MKILVLGATGLIGHKVFYELKQNANLKVFGVARGKLNESNFHSFDANDSVRLKNFLIDFQIDVVVNCIGCLISESTQNVSGAILTNALLPSRLAEFSADLKIKLIHISTDCVFSGIGHGQYTEKSLPDGHSVYARTKALGEIATKNHLVIRTSVIGPELTNRNEELFNWFMFQRKQFHGFHESVWSGVTTVVLARAIAAAINSEIVGIYHLTNNLSITKYDLLKLMIDIGLNDAEILKVSGTKTNKSFINTRNFTLYKVPSYKQMISDMKYDMDSNRNLYKKVYKEYYSKQGL